MNNKLFLNGQILDCQTAGISPLDSGFLYGAGVFETMRAHNSIVFSLKDHLDRLEFSAKRLSISMFERQYLTDAVYSLLEANNLTDARIRLTITNGPMDGKQDKPEPTVLITAVQFEPYPEEYYKKGIRVALSAFKQNPSNPVFYHKTLNYMPRLLALNEARQKGASESIWFTVDNRLAEASTANVFLVKDSALLTPPVDTPVLAGIGRKTVISLAHNLNIKVTEKTLHIHDLLEADEVFLTNVIMQILAVNSIEKHPVSNGQVGPITKKLAQAYIENLQSCCNKRID